MSRRTAARLGWSFFALTVLLILPALVLNFGRSQYSNLGVTTGEQILLMVFVLFGWFGALIVSRLPRQPIGWILCALGLSAGIKAFAAEYAIYGLITQPGAAPGAAVLTWVTSWESAPDLALLAALFVLFPDGRPLSPRWRWVLWLAGFGFGCSIFAALSLWPLRGAELLRLYGAPEPVGMFEPFYAIGFWAGLAAVLLAIVSLVLRFRRARRVAREQIKWLVYAVVTVALGLPFAMGVLAALDSSELAADVAGGLLLTLIPVAVGVAILKHRLYDVDRLINRTVVYAVLTALLGAVYASVVLVLGQLFGEVSTEPPSWVVAGATLAAAALFQPARRRIQQVVDRRFNRRRYDATKTIEAFSTRLRDQVDLETLAVELVAVADQTMQPSRAAFWLRQPAGRTVI